MVLSVSENDVSLLKPMSNISYYKQLADSVKEPYFNTVISKVNDHVVRLSVMTSGYPWHYHPNSDEIFIGVDGTVIIETELDVLELAPGACITIPKNVVHCTRPKDGRSVNLTIEAADLETVFVDKN